MNLRRPRDEGQIQENKVHDTYNSSGIQNTFSDIFNKIQSHFLPEDHVKFLKKEEMSVFLSEAKFANECENLDTLYFSSSPDHDENYTFFDPLDLNMGRKFT